MRKFIGFWAALAGLFLSLGMIVTSGSPAQAAPSPIRLYRIYYNSPGPDRGGNASLNEEYVELQNTAASPINLTGWRLHDAGQKHTYTFGAYTIKAHGYVLVHTGKGSETPSQLYWGLSWYVWNNTGDTATLKDRHNDVIDRCSYSDPQELHNSASC